MIKLTEQEIRDRLAHKLKPDEIDQLVEEYRESSNLVLPDMDAITRLSQKGHEENLLKVNFRLSQEQYDALIEYYNESGQTGTYVVQRAIQEFIAMV